MTREGVGIIDRLVVKNKLDYKDIYKCIEDVKFFESLEGDKIKKNDVVYLFSNLENLKNYFLVFRGTFIELKFENYYSINLFLSNYFILF